MYKPAPLPQILVDAICDRAIAGHVIAELAEVVAAECRLNICLSGQKEQMAEVILLKFAEDYENAAKECQVT